jgi:hypothetical protein
MTTKTRTDIHRPSALITEDYDFFGCGYFGSQGEPGFSPLSTPLGKELLDEGWRFGENESAGSCYHCGAHLKYYALLLHQPSHTIIRVGETCLDNRFERSSVEFHALRKQASLDRQAHRIKNLRLGWFATNPDRETAFAWASERVSDGDYGYEGMRHNFVSKINRDGETSDKFVRAIMRDMARSERIAAERAAEREAEEAEKGPVITGQGIAIQGEVISTKWQENDFGGRLVMTVKDDRGFLVWGSVPRAIDNVEKGERVSFTANVEASDRDESFGFFKRPRAAAILEA